MMLRAAAIIVGLALLAATAHITVLATGGYGTPHAALSIVLAGGVGIGALSIGRAWSDQRRPLALGIGLALLCGEAYGLLGTAERLIAQREATQAPARAATAIRTDATRRVKDAETALAAVPNMSSRLTAALAAHIEATRSATTKAAERHCGANCRQLLEQGTAAAEREVSAARNELAAMKRRAEVDLAEARAAIEAAPIPASEAPLADRLGIASWILDLAAAALGSIAANGLGALLLAFGAHRPADATPLVATKHDSADFTAACSINEAGANSSRHIQVPTMSSIGGSARHPLIDHVDRFAVAAICKKPRGRTTLADVHAAYQAWCRAEGIAPAAAGDFAETIGKLVKAAGITVRLNDRKEPILVGVGVSPELFAIRESAVIKA